MTHIHLPPPEEKPRYVQRMFARISDRYDLMNRVMTGGQDRVWRRMVVELCELPSGGRILDVATGTGDIVYEAMRRHPHVRPVGVDLTLEMMLAGRHKFNGRSIPFVQGDALHLPFADNSFDAACSGFMMRNVVDIAQAFAEQRRVVRPGGKVVCLEITRPRRGLWRPLFHLYFHRIVPLLGAIIGRERAAYTYLPHSTLTFPDADTLADIMRQVGLHDVYYRTVMFGTIAIHVGRVGEDR